jgi:hypothetical protein
MISCCTLCGCHAFFIFCKIAGSWSAAFSLAAGAAFASSVGVTIYTEITKCNDYEPDECKEASCSYYDCPKVCTNPDVNDKFMRNQRDEMTDLLNEMEKTKTKGMTVMVL